MKVDIRPLLQGYKDLDKCLVRLKDIKKDFSEKDELKRLERMMEVSLDVLENRITELRKLGYEDPMKHKMFKR
ncbi:MAG: hypothetical protein KAX31_05090 [Thermoplasmata archaeon]|nr:hypothetical protein [Thermoplasmata archaeon]